jgi:sterol 3beta-glucosyltransferase
MRIAIVAVGSLGDVRPFVALATGLIRKGYTVRLASHAPFREMAVDNGLEFAPVEGNPRDLVRGEEGQAWLASTNNPLAFMLRMSKIAGLVLDKLSTDALEASRGSDAVIYNLPLAASGYSIAESLGVPGIPASLYPLHPTRAFPSIVAPSLPVKGGAANWLSGFLAAELFWRIFSSHHNRWRRKTGLRTLPFNAPLGRFERAAVPYLYGYSLSVIPIPRGWKESRAVCGYWFLDRPREWQPPRKLLDFLGQGEPPLYVGFGSMAEGSGDRLTGIVLEALERTGRRAILAAGWGELGTRSLPARVLGVESVPHDWLLPRVAAAIHHGGAGTTAAVLRAGVPSITVPFFADQFFWGGRIAELGVGPVPIPRKRLTVSALVQAIEDMHADRGMGERCRALARRIALEDGIGKAAETVDRYLRSTTRRINQRRSLPGRAGASLPSSRDSQPTA